MKIDWEKSKEALRQGLEICRREGNDRPELRQLVWRLLQDASETLHRLPDRERSWLMAADRVYWPELARPSEENRIVEWEIGVSIALGHRTYDHVPVHFPVTDPSAPSRCLTVLSWLQLVKARNFERVKRDRLIVLYLAGGWPKKAKDLMGREKSDAAVYAIKGKALVHICHGLEREITWKCHSGLLEMAS